MLEVLDEARLVAMIYTVSVPRQNEARDARGRHGVVITSGPIRFPRFSLLVYFFLDHRRLPARNVLPALHQTGDTALGGDVLDALGKQRWPAEDCV